jgi:hypothetical protein
MNDLSALKLLGLAGCGADEIAPTRGDTAQPPFKM